MLVIQFVEAKSFWRANHIEKELLLYVCDYIRRNSWQLPSVGSNEAFSQIAYVAKWP